MKVVPNMKQESNNSIKKAPKTIRTQRTETRGRKRDRQTDRQRETDRQTETGGQTCIQTDRQTKVNQTHKSNMKTVNDNNNKTTTTLETSKTTSLYYKNKCTHSHPTLKVTVAPVTSAAQPTSQRNSALL